MGAEDSPDVVVVGAGHNGLVAALLLARAGLAVTVIEANAVIGGAARSERPFAAAPELATSTGAYLLGLMPPELLAELAIDLPLVRRDPHYFVPTTGSRYLLLGGDPEATKQQFASFFSQQDWRAHQALQSELAQLRDDVAPTWLREPLSIEATAEQFIRPALREIFIDLCRKPVSDYLARFEFRSDLVQAMYAVTDGFSGLDGGWDSPGTGMNFLIHNMCRLPGADGTWMVVRGGMGTVTQKLGYAATMAGARIVTGTAVAAIERSGGRVSGVALADGRTVACRAVLCNADPFRMRDLIGADAFPATFNARLDGYRRDGTTFKLNMALSELPEFTCLPEPRGQHGGTIHLLPDEEGVLEALRSAYRDAKAGKLPEFPSIEWYIHTAVDPSMRDAQGRHNAALFVQWVPNRPAEGSWDELVDGYAAHLLSICDRFAPGTSARVVDTLPLHPQAIESRFGMTAGHIHHVDNSFGFADRLPYASPVDGLYSCSAGTHPAGSVIGCAGHNAAHRILADLGRRGAN